MEYLENPRVLNPPKDSFYRRLQEILKDDVHTSMVHIYQSVISGEDNAEDLANRMRDALRVLERPEFLQADENTQNIYLSNVYFTSIELYLTYFTFRRPKLCSNLSLSEDLAYQLYLSGTRDVPYHSFALDLPITYIDVSKAKLSVDFKDFVSQEYFAKNTILGVVFIDCTYTNTPLHKPLEKVVRLKTDKYTSIKNYIPKYTYLVIVKDKKGKTKNTFDGQIYQNDKNELFSVKGDSFEPIADFLYTMQDSKYETTVNLGIALDMAVKSCILKRLGDYRGQTEQFSTPEFRAAQSKKRTGGSPKKKKGKKKAPPRVSPYAITYMQSSDVPWIPPEDEVEFLEREINELNAELQRQSPNTRDHYKMIWVVERYIHQNNVPESDIYTIDESRPRRNRYGEQIFKRRYLIKKLYTFDNTSDEVIDTPTVHVKRLSTRHNPMSDMHFYVYDIGTIPMYAPFLENDVDIDIDSLMELEPEFISYGFEFLAANEDDENFEDMKELQLGKIDYLVIGSAGGSADCYVLVSSPEMYKAFVEYMLTNPVLDSLVKADADYIIDNIRNEDAFVFIKGKPHMPIVNRKGKLPTHDSTRHNPMSKYTLYRGTPYSGLDLDDLEGGGGRGHEMLGSGLYCTDEYHVAANYAQGDNACVYTLELNIPNEEILEINPHSTNVNFLGIESANSIERDFFGLTAPAFTLKIKDRNTGENVTYLISEYEDVLEYEEDLKRAIATEILSLYGLYTSDYNDEWDSDWGTWEIRDYLTEVFEALEDPEMQDYPEVQAYSKHLESLKQKLASQSDDVEEYIIELLENEYIQKIRERHYPYYEDDTVLWGGDSTELANIARQHGYKVLWCSDWISSGNEVVIVDDSIYNNGLVIVDDCSED